jgi:VanZ family protein
MNKALSIWAPPIIYVLIIVVLSLRPMPETIPGNMDKIIHLIAYTLAGLLFTRAAVSGMHLNRITRPVALALISSILLGTLIEALQHFIPYRDASVPDIAANAVGTFIGVSIYIRITKSNRGQAHASS